MGYLTNFRAKREIFAQNGGNFGISPTIAYFRNFRTKWSIFRISTKRRVFSKCSPLQNRTFSPIMSYYRNFHPKCGIFGNFVQNGIFSKFSRNIGYFRNFRQNRDIFAINEVNRIFAQNWVF